MPLRQDTQHMHVRSFNLAYVMLKEDTSAVKHLKSHHLLNYDSKKLLEKEQTSFAVAENFEDFFAQLYNNN